MHIINIVVPCWCSTVHCVINIIFIPSFNLWQLQMIHHNHIVNWVVLLSCRSINSSGVDAYNRKKYVKVSIKFETHSASYQTSRVSFEWFGFWLPCFTNEQSRLLRPTIWMMMWCTFCTVNGSTELYDDRYYLRLRHPSCVRRSGEISRIL